MTHLCSVSKQAAAGSLFVFWRVRFSETCLNIVSAISLKNLWRYCEQHEAAQTNLSFYAFTAGETFEPQSSAQACTFQRFWYICRIFSASDTIDHAPAMVNRIKNALRVMTEPLSVLIVIVNIRAFSQECG
ncbi:MAG: hypothetical protein LBE75_03505 [Burkholderiales bacterium]|nr:hypothetical protein [Burkholderiales bacterium]